jgi:uncharacterized membrane protein
MAVEELAPRWDDRGGPPEEAGATGKPEASRLALMMAFLGATLVGIGVILFVSANWRGMQGWTKLALVVVGMVAAYSAAFRLRFGVKVREDTAGALFYLGAILFGAALFVVAQGMHVNADEPVLMVMWAAGMLPLAYFLKSRAALVLVVISLELALGWELMLWLEDVSPHIVLASFLAFGTLLYALGNLHGASERYGPFKRVYGAAGLVTVFLALFPLTFDFAEFALIGTETSDGGIPAGLAVRYFVLLGIAACATVASLFVRRPPRTLLIEVGAQITVLMVSSLLYRFPSGGGVWLNLLFLALTVGAVVAGTLNRDRAWVNIGVFWFAALLFARYFDWVQSMMMRSAYAAATGAVLLLVAFWIEWSRSRPPELRIVGKGE